MEAKKLMFSIIKNYFLSSIYIQKVNLPKMYIYIYKLIVSNGTKLGFKFTYKRLFAKQI